MKSSLPLETDGYSSWNRAGASPRTPGIYRFRVSGKGNAYIPSIEIKAIEWAIYYASTILELPFRMAESSGTVKHKIIVTWQLTECKNSMPSLSE